MPTTPASLTQRAFDLAFSAWWHMERQSKVNGTVNFAAHAYREATFIAARAARVSLRLRQQQMKASGCWCYECGGAGCRICAEWPVQS